MCPACHVYMTLPSPSRAHPKVENVSNVVVWSLGGLGDCLPRARVDEGPERAGEGVLQLRGVLRRLRASEGTHAKASQSRRGSSRALPWWMGCFWVGFVLFVLDFYVSGGRAHCGEKAAQFTSSSGSANQGTGPGMISWLPSRRPTLRTTPNLPNVLCMAAGDAATQAGCNMVPE